MALHFFWWSFLFFGGLSVKQHNIHLTYSRMVISETEVIVQISFFTDDFDTMLTRFHGRRLPRLAHDGSSDSLLLPYLKQHFVLSQASEDLSGRIIESGLNADMCWYRLRYEIPDGFTSLVVKNTLLHEVFPDQKNLFNVLDEASGQRWSYYFVEGDSLFRMNIRD